MNIAAVALMQQTNHDKAISSFETSLSCLHSQFVGGRVLLYNMGLAYHCQGIRNGTSRELKLALQLYEASLKVFENKRQHFSSLYNQADLLLALINNMGHIFSYFYDLKGMDRCQRHIQTLLESTPEVFELFQEEEEDYTFFASALSSSYYRLDVAAAA
jgi:tetratricopeptide (TPR) repeat protein